MSEPVDRSRQATARLEALVGRLSDGELGQDVGDGSTAAAVLAHIAFWDRAAVHCWRRFLDKGERRGPLDLDLINDGVLHLGLALTPRAAADEAVAAARAADETLAGLPASAFADYPAEGNNRWLRELWEHREEHLELIERSPGGASTR